jgi:hypothetical protein
MVAEVVLTSAAFVVKVRLSSSEGVITMLGSFNGIVFAWVAVMVCVPEDRSGRLVCSAKRR